MRKAHRAIGAPLRTQDALCRITQIDTGALTARVVARFPARFGASKSAADAKKLLERGSVTLRGHERHVKNTVNNGVSDLRCSNRAKVFLLRFCLVSIYSLPHVSRRRNEKMATEPIGKTVVEVAKTLRCSTRHVLRLIAEGRIRAINTSLTTKKPRWLVRDCDLQAFIDRQTSEVTCG